MYEHVQCRYALTCYPLNRTHVHTIYVTCEVGISAILCLRRHSSAPLPCWCDSVHHRMAVSSSSIVMFVSTSYKQYEMRDLEFGYQWSTTADLNYKEQYKVQEDAMSKCPVSGVDRTCHYKSSEVCGNGQQCVCSLCTQSSLQLWLYSHVTNTIPSLHKLG